MADDTTKHLGGFDRALHFMRNGYRVRRNDSNWQDSFLRLHGDKLIKTLIGYGKEHEYELQAIYSDDLLATDWITA